MTKKRYNRPTNRRLTLEPLEDRQLLSATWYETNTITSTVDAFALEMWDWINQFRADPDGMLYRVFNDPEQLYNFNTFDSLENGTVRAAKDLEVDIAIKDWILKDLTGDELKSAVDAFLQSWYSLDSASPLAISSALSNAAQTHNQKMIDAYEAAHQVDGEKSLAERLQEIGFTNAAENIAYGGKLRHNNSGSTFSVVSYLFASFAIDWGNPDLVHRVNMLSNTQTEMGVSVKSTDYLGPYVTTVDFATGTQGARDDGAYLFGLIYNDRNGDGFYTAQNSEGLSLAYDGSGYRITVTCKTGVNTDSSVILNSSGNGLSQNGAYQIFLENGEYEVKISGGAFGEGYSRTVIVSGGENVKADFTIQGMALGKPSLDLDTESLGTGASAEFLEAGDAVGLVTNFEIEATTLTQMKITFDSRPDGSDEMLSVAIPSDSGLRVFRNTVTGEIDVFGSNDVSVYVEILKSLSYYNSKGTQETGGVADLSERSVAVSVYNGFYWSDEAFIALTITPTIFPELSIADADVWEWETDSGALSGQKTLVFNVMLSCDARMDVSFHYEVVGGTAQIGVNYLATDSSGSITIKAGDHRAEIRVTVYGDYEINDDLTLQLSVNNVVNVKNTDWTNRFIVGTIRDDDTPIELVQDQIAWSSDVAGSFERGERRFLYAYRTQAAGLVKWSAMGNNLTVTVYADWSKGTSALATSKWVDGRETVEWYAAAGVEYTIKLEGLYTYRNPSLTLLTLAANNQTVSVDPLLDLDGHLTVSIDETGLQLGNGANQWSLPLSILAQLESLNLSTTKANAIFDFSFANGTELSFDAGNHQLGYGDALLNLAGFSGYQISGGNSRETLLVTGSDDNDLLVYDGASGSLTIDYDNENVPEKVSYVFSDITNLKFDGGGGTGDVARLSDSTSNDSVVCSSNEVTLTGGGHALSVNNFNDITLSARAGGVNALSVRSSDWADMILQLGMVRFSGTDLTRPYLLTAVGLNSIRVDASDANGRITLFGISDSDLNYWATLGYVKALNTQSGLSVEVVSATDLELAGVDDSRQDQVTLLEADVSDFVGPQKNDDKQVYTGTIEIKEYQRQLKLTLPVWATSLKNRGSDEDPVTFAAETQMLAPLETFQAAELFAPILDSESADAFLTSLALDSDEANESFGSKEQASAAADTALERIPAELLCWWSDDTSVYRRKKYATLF